MTTPPGKVGQVRRYETMPVRPAKAILETRNRQCKLDSMQYWVSVSIDTWHVLYIETLHRYARWVQELPDLFSLSGRTPVCGRLVDNALQFSMDALKLRKAFILPPGADPEEIDLSEPYWTYAVFVAALLCGLGNKLRQLDVMLTDAEGLTSAAWDYRAGPMPMESLYVPASLLSPAQQEDLKQKNEQAGNACDLELALQIVPSRGKHWLTCHENVYTAWAQYLESGGKEGVLAFVTRLQTDLYREDGFGGPQQETDTGSVSAGDVNSITGSLVEATPTSSRLPKVSSRALSTPVSSTLARPEPVQSIPAQTKSVESTIAASTSRNSMGELSVDETTHPAEPVTHAGVPRKSVEAHKVSQRTLALLSGLRDQAVTRFLVWLNRQVADNCIVVNAVDSPVHCVRDGVLLVVPDTFNLFRNAGFDQPDIQRRLLQQKLHIRNLLGSEHLCQFEHRHTGEGISGIVLKDRAYLPVLSDTVINKHLQRRVV